MTVNVNALIKHIGKSYKEICEAKLIPYSTGPKGHSGSPTISLEMVKEGVVLSFLRENRTLKEITLYIQRDGINNWTFPNDLPQPLQHEMSRDWIMATFGQPSGSVAPRKVLRHSLGWVDKYQLSDTYIPVTMQIDYDLSGFVKEVSYIITSEMRW